jgi:hypothetical protein
LVSGIVDDATFIPSSTSELAVPFEALVDDDFVGSEVTLTAHGAAGGASMPLIDVIPSSSGMIQPVNHILLVDIRKIFLLQDLNVQVFSPFQLGLQIGLTTLTHVDIGHSIPWN